MPRANRHFLPGYVWHLMRKIISLLFLSLVSISNCARAEKPTIKHGVFFGECIGYCVSEIEVSDSGVIYKAKYIGPRQKGMPPEKNSKASITAAVWNELAHSIEENNFLELKDRYGCPDCADQGGEWIEIKFADGNKKRVTFDYNRPPKKVLNMLKKLQIIHSDFGEKRGILGSAGPIPNTPSPRENGPTNQ